jgi:predicted RNase H-like HicB family nuclease
LLESLGFEERVRAAITCSGGAGRARQAVPSEAGPGGHLEGEAWFRTMTKYEIIIYWSEEDGAFVAEVPELPGCVAHGPTQERALGNAQDAIRLWIDTAKEFGDAVPEPKGRRLLLAWRFLVYPG